MPPNEGWLPEDQFEAYLAKRGRLPGPISPGTAELKRSASCPPPQLYSGFLSVCRRC